MASFVAFNVEPEEDSEDEIDDTKEIQIEEALKLYQAALKLHSQELYEEAALAYDNLFASEIFTYPESLPQVERLGLYDETEIHEGVPSLSPRANVSIENGGIDGAPSTLAQILYLSYKNHGQFLLDLLTNQVQKDSRDIEWREGASSTILSSLRRLVEALDRDDTDLGLWRQVARICESLGSTRVARYCLEAVLAADRDGTDHWPELLSLDRIFAVEQLTALLRALGDNSKDSKMTIPPASKKCISGPLKKYIDPCPHLPQMPPTVFEHQSHREQSTSLIKVEMRGWNSCGKAIMLQICQEGPSLVGTTPEVRYSLQFPNQHNSSTQQNAGVSEEKEPSLVLKSVDDALRLVTDGHLNTVSRANSVLDEKAGKEPTAYVHTIDSDDESRNNEAAVSNASSLVKDPGPDNFTQAAQQNLREGESTCKDNQTDQFHTASQVEEQPGNFVTTPNLPAVVSLPTRKRSTDSAGLQENVDTGRVRSKRIKARGSMNESNTFKEVSPEELNQFYDDQFRPTDEADSLLSDAARAILSKLEVEYPEFFGASQEARSPILSRGSLIESSSKLVSSNVAAQDFLGLLSTWDKESTAAFLYGDGLDGKLGGSNNLSGPRNSGLNLFLEHSKRGSEFGSQKPLFPDDEDLEAFATEIEESWTYLDQLALKWIEALLAPRRTDRGAVFNSRYEDYVWPETLKRTVVLLLVMRDEYIYSEMYSRLKRLDTRILETTACDKFDELQTSEEDLIQTVQNIFELHLDTYGKAIGPSSEVDPPTRILQLDRLGRWAMLAHDAISKKASSDKSDCILDSLDIRFLWASVLHTSLIDPMSREHTILCFEDLKRTLTETGSPAIELANNCMMPDISSEAAEREISRVTTMDFFLNLFNNQESNPLMIIEGLEPILEQSVQIQGAVSTESTKGDELVLVIDEEEKRTSSPERLPDVSSKEYLSQDQKQMLQFVDQASISLKDILWEKLGEAYVAIAYPPKALSCALRRIEIIAGYLGSDAFVTKSTSDRYSGLLRWLRVVGDLITKALTLILNETGIIHLIDTPHLCSAIKAILYFQRILYVQLFWEDSIRIGKIPPPKVNCAHEDVQSVFNKLRDMLVRIWIIQYSLFKEAYEQNPHLSTEPEQDFLEYLNSLHHALGLRGFCKVSDRLFPIFMKKELMQLKGPESSDISMVQLIYDLYGLKVCLNPAYLEDHGCPAAPLECETAIQIIDLVMNQARKMNIKDISKSELKLVIDKMQQAIASPKNTTTIVLNRRIISAFLKSPINPVDLYRSLRGIGSLNGAAASNFSTIDYSIVGDKGWYLLIGHIALAKFRSQKRLFPGSFDDLEIANTFFRLDLELGLEKWETWYRLAQVFDAMIEEATTWTAEKLNSKMSELASLQRNAIHCYTMAVAAAIRIEDASCESADKICELYADFACRIYASSREPFSMEAFALQDFTKPYNGETRGMYKGHPFRTMTVYSAWKFASVLFQRALGHKSGSWINYYMLGKCLWKMHNCGDEIRGQAPRINHTEVLAAFTRAVKLLPERRDNRHSEKDPTLEPHYKLVSIVHKLVQSKKIQPGEGCEYLKATSYASKFTPVQDLDGWEGYLIGVLRSLRSADKSNWHHRMVARAAHTIYDDAPDDLMAALGAKHELTQQIFTKTMHTQIWKPDNERPGRHFVYTSRYVSFFVRLLSQLNDRNNLEALARRVRKKSGDFFNHAKIWEEVCMAYLKLLRRHGSVIDGNEDVVFKSLPYPTFLLNAERLETWAHSPNPTTPTLEILREAVELKKLNANLMKPGLIEDLVGDTYAMLYAAVVPELVTKSNNEENRVRMRVDQLLTDPTTEKFPPSDGKSIEVIITGAAPKQARAKSVSRREIQRRAEAIVLARSVAPPPTSKPRPISSPKILAAVEIPEKAGISRQTNSSGALLAVKEREDGGKDIGSIPGSLHDSADDESELSDVEELMEDMEPPPRVLFPGLVAGRDRKARKDEAEEEGDDGEGEEEAGGEGEGDGEGEGGEEEEEEEEEKGQDEKGRMKEVEGEEEEEEEEEEEGEEEAKKGTEEDKEEEEKMEDQDEVKVEDEDDEADENADGEEDANEDREGEGEDEVEDDDDDEEPPQPSASGKKTIKDDHRAEDDDDDEDGPE